MENLFNIIIFLIGTSMIYISFTSRIEVYIKVLSFQGFMLFLLILLNIMKMELLSFIFLITETLAFKTVIIPALLMRMIRKNGIYREVEPYIPNYFSLIISTLILVFGFFIVYISRDFSGNIKPVYFGISISVMMTGLFIILSRKKIVTHILGYMFLENGIFLLSLSVAEEMPIIINLGVFLDIFICIFVFGLFVSRIRSTFDELDIDTLSKLKD
jgi:hydrogenase-4 component E